MWLLAGEVMLLLIVFVIGLIGRFGTPRKDLPVNPDDDFHVIIGAPAQEL